MDASSWLGVPAVQACAPRHARSVYFQRHLRYARDCDFPLAPAKSAQAMHQRPHNPAARVLHCVP
jgi:hypothetical protein